MDRLLCWKKIQGDGLSFENIIKELLKVMFPLEKFKHTKETRDGGKDFVCITQNTESYWAECKNYSDNLALSDVAKTFVMAIAEDIKKVMIFSISPFTEVALQEISLFTDKIQYELKVYDGKALDTLMYKYIDKVNLSNDFKRDFLLTYQPEKDITTFSCITRNNYLDELPNRHFYIGDLVTYNFYFKNNTSTRVNIKYTFSMEQLPDELLLISADNLSGNNFIELDPGSYIQCSCRFRILNYKKRLRLFDVHYEVNEEIGIIKGKYIECDWIAEVPLLGESREQLQKLKQDSIGNPELSVINLYGHSGVGKSRLMKEILNAYQDNNYKTIFIPVHETRDNGAFLIRKLISVIKNLPYIPSEDITVNSDELIYQVLYNTKYNILENLDTILQLIYEALYAQRQVVVVIDDLQFGDSLLLSVVRNILNSVNQKIILVTGFNEDYIYTGTNAQRLFAQIKSYSLPNQNIELKDFDSTTAKQYIHNCLDKNLLIENRLDKTINMFIEHIGTNPLLLHQTILYLAQKHILEKNEAYFFIKDIENFHRTIKDLNPNFKDLLVHRHKALQDNISKDAYYFYLILTKILSVFRRIPLRLYKEMFNTKTEDWIAQLIALGFIKYNDIGDIVFYHQKLESFYFDLNMEDSVITKASDIVQTLSDSYFHEKIILKEQAKLLQEIDYFSALNHLDDVDYNNELRYISAIYRSNDLFQIENSQLLSVTERYYRIIQQHRGIRYELENYKKTVFKLLNNVAKYKEFASLLWRITLTCVNAFIQLYKEEEALKLLIQYEACIDSFDCIGQEKKNILAALFNRYGVIYNTFNNSQKAEYYYKESLKLGLEIQDKYKIIEAYSDYGSLFYDKKGQLWKTLYYWTKLFSYYKKCEPSQYEYLMPKCYYHKIYVYLLLKKYKKAEQLLNEYKELYWAQTNGHYKVKILFINIVLEMLKTKNDCEEIKFLLNQAEDECVCIGTVREYYKVFYLKALYYLYFEPSEKEAYANLKITYLQLGDICQKSEYLLQRNSLVLAELSNLILKYESTHPTLESTFFSDNTLQKLNKQIQHAYKNGGNRYRQPLKSRKGEFFFPKL